MKYILFTTTTCPKCPETKQLVTKLKTKGKILDETTPEFFSLAQNYNVSVAPTFILLDDNETEIGRANDPYSIQRLLN